MWRSLKSSSPTLSWRNVWSSSLVEILVLRLAPVLSFIKLLDTEEAKIEEVLCKLGCDLDGRFSSVRTAETNLGNLLCDVMLAALQAE